MFEEPKKRLGALLGRKYIEFPSAGEERVAALKARFPSGEEYGRLIRTISDPAARYETEYAGGYYHSYKPGIDDVRLAETFRSVVEVGGGPSYIARHAPNSLRFCVDIVGHPDHAKHGIMLIRGDICESGVVEQVGGVVGPKLKEIQTPRCAGSLIVLSYCLDRVSDQRKALCNFAQLINLFEGGRGLITVCLPAVPMSPGSSEVHYNRGAWITIGTDPIEQFQLIREAVEREQGKECIVFRGGGLTTHHGVSLVDGYEELPCYVLWFSNGSRREQLA